MKFRTWARCGVFGVLASSPSHVVLADEASGAGSAPFVLDYVVPRDCPDRSVALAAIRRRDERLVEAEQAPTERHFRILVEAERRRFTGRLEQSALGSVRQVTGPDCAKVVDALSLVLALAAGATPGSADSVELAEEEAAPSARPPPPPPRREAPKAVPPTTPEAPRATARLQTPGLEWAVGVGGAGLWGAAPGLLAGPALALERTHDEGWLFVRLLGRLEYGVGAPRNRLEELVPELGIRGFFGSIDLAAHAGLAFGVLKLERDTAASNLWVTPLLGPTLRLHPSPHWWLEFAVEAGVPLLSRQVRSAAGPTTTKMEGVVVGAGILGGFGGLFGERERSRIGSAAIGHSRVQ